jgi:RND superfamily putative drug exporter
VTPTASPARTVWKEYARPSGLTSADRAKAGTDASRFAQVAGVVHGQVTGPFFARDGKAIETIVPVNLGSKGWNGASAAVTALRATSPAPTRTD